MSENTENMVSKEEFESLKATNERILAEHKADKSKWKNRFEDFENQKKEHLSKKEDFKGLFEQESVKVKTLEERISSLQYNTFEKNLALEVTKLAKDAHNPNAIIRSLSISESNTDLDNGTLTDLSTQIDDLRKNETYLFKQENVKQTNSIPRYMTNNNEEKQVSDMTVDEIEKVLKSTV